MDIDKLTLERYGREVARLRRDAEIIQAVLARRLGISPAQMSNIENGAAVPRPRIRTELTKILSPSGYLDRLWEDLNGSGRQPWLNEITELTQQAAAVNEYQALAFPAYLQTEDYARALIRYGVPWLTPDEVESRVRARVKRSRHMADAIAPKLWLVVDETLLKRRYGAPSTTREQLTYVAELAERERLTLQMIPADCTRHPGTSGPFRLITEFNGPDVVYVESAHQGQVITATADVGRYRMWYSALQGIAVTPQAALEVLRDEVKRLDHE